MESKINIHLGLIIFNNMNKNSNAFTILILSRICKHEIILHFQGNRETNQLRSEYHTYF